MFDYTYRKVFSQRAYRRTWVALGVPDMALRNSCVVGLICAYVFGAVVMGRYPVSPDLLQPHVMQFPFVLLAGIWLYFVAWTSDQFPVQSRCVLLMSAVAALVTFVIKLQSFDAPSMLPYMGFLAYFAIVAALAGVQLVEIRQAQRATSPNRTYSS